MNNILSFTDVDYSSISGKTLPLSGINIDVYEKQLIGIWNDTPLENIPLFDLASGLLDPSRGIVLFKGNNWNEMSYDALCGNRSRIGRVFEANAWLSNLTVKENICLCRQHHGYGTDKDIIDDMDELASFFKLETIPDIHHDKLKQNILTKCQWIRAFLNGRDLILMQNPGRSVSSVDIEKLMRKVKETKQTGTAFVIITRISRMWELLRTDSDLSFVLDVSGKLKLLEETE